MSWRSRRMKQLRNASHSVIVSDLTEHHRKPRSCGGKSTPSNISKISRAKHEAWHTLFGDMSPHQIARYATTVLIDPDYMLIAVHRQQHTGW